MQRGSSEFTAEGLEDNEIGYPLDFLAAGERSSKRTSEFKASERR